MINITYIDNTKFHSTNPQESHWNEIDNIIKTLEYRLYDKKILLGGYDSYNHLVCYSQNLAIQENKLTAIILMAKDNQDVIRFIFDLINQELIIDEVLFGQEYKGKASSGWKKGTYNNPQYKIE